VRCREHTNAARPTPFQRHVAEVKNHVSKDKTVILNCRVGGERTIWGGGSTSIVHK